ncbi:MFS transporter [Sporichthya polymorpha]|uniref:MFS transporter n=1 Tax=Sporichthya polymorpha TaxID=35751 RepID=UPI0003771012|nr:MFS transporter [Sporichthya polymorpha]
MAIGLAVYGLAGGAGLFTDSYPALLASRVLFGLGAALVFTGSTVGLLNLFRGAAQDRVMGWRTSATAVGALSWPLIGGALGTLSWHAPFGVYLVGVGVGAAALRALPDDRPAHRPAAGIRTALGVARRHRALLGY